MMLLAQTLSSTAPDHALLATSEAWSIVAWLLIAIITFLLTGLYCGAETGLYSISRLRLHIREHHGQKSAKVVANWLEHPTYPLEGLLVLQNIATFSFSTAVTHIFMLFGYSPAMEATLSTLLIAPIIIVFAEIMPKDLFRHKADTWVYRTVPWLQFSFILITIIPILPLIRLLGYLTQSILRLQHTTESQTLGHRQEFAQHFDESEASGAITGAQRDLVQHALRMVRTKVGDVMVPWSRVIGIPAKISTPGFIAIVKHYPISRMPVLGNHIGEVIGVVEVLQVLADTEINLKRHTRPVMTLITEQPVRSAITLMQSARQTIAVVVNHKGDAVGLVTMKDLAEELVGELENW
ncbi:MAG: CNNM domain-containing protein [Phycisphaerae bacterium]